MTTGPSTARPITQVDPVLFEVARNVVNPKPSCEPGASEPVFSTEMSDSAVQLSPYATSAS